MSRKIGLAPGVYGGLTALEVVCFTWGQLTAPDALGNASLLVLQPVLNFASMRCRHDGGESESCGDNAMHKLFPLLGSGRCTRRSADVCAKRHITFYVEATVGVMQR